MVCRCLQGGGQALAWYSVLPRVLLGQPLGGVWCVGSEDCSNWIGLSGSLMCTVRLIGVRIS